MRTIMSTLAAALLAFLLVATSAVSGCPHGNHGPAQRLAKRANVCGTTSSAKFFGYSASSTTATLTGSTCPGYDWTGQKTPNTCYQSCMSFSYPAVVRINSQPLYVGVYTDLAQTTKNSNPVMGPIGLAVNGVPLYGNSDADKRDAYAYEGSSFDSCRGHCSIQNQYHYHTVPAQGCVFTDTAGKHSPLLGVMKDGIPIFGELGDNGKVPTDLDECNLHVDASYPFPHYHVTAGMKYPYLVNCLRGCVDGSSCSPTATYNMTDKIGALLKTYSSSGTCGANNNNNVVATTAKPPIVAATTAKPPVVKTTVKAAAAPTTKRPAAVPTRPVGPPPPPGGRTGPPKMLV